LFVRNIEEGVIRLLADFGIQGERIREYTGVWVKSDGNGWSKICAIGVHLSRWISMHGFALNIDPQLNYFDNIVACGIQDEDKSITSLAKLTGYQIDIEVIKNKLFNHYRDIFGF
jgi:lipoyl(octanoyl) transferase